MKSTISSFIKFVAVGGVGLLVNLGITYMLTDLLGVWYFWSYTVATLVSWSSIFLMNSLFTFAGHDKERYGTRYMSFLTAYLVAFVINASLVYLLTSHAGVHYLFSIIIATVITTGITFTISRMFIFTYGAQD